MLNLKKNITTALFTIATLLFLFPSFTNANGTPCEKVFVSPITDADAFAEAMTKNMRLSEQQTDLWNLYRNNWFGSPRVNIGKKDLPDVFEILKKYPELSVSELSIQEQIIQFSIREVPRDENLTRLLSQFRRMSLNKINNLYQIENNLNFWTTILIYPKMDAQGSLSKAQRKNLKQQYNQEFLSYLENFIDSEKRQFIADSANHYRTRAVDLYQALKRIRTSLEQEGKNTEPVSRAMVDVVETVGFGNESYMNKLKSSNAIENMEGVQNILAERDIVAFDLGFHRDHFTELKETLLKQSPTEEINTKESSSQDIEQQLIEMATEIAGKTQTTERSRETLRLRSLSLQESAFRSCLGGDCTTRENFELAFDPNFLFFTLTDSQHRSSGQITLVLGEAKDAEGRIFKTAFVDNIHNIPLKRIYPMLEGISLSLSEYGYQLSLPKNVKLDADGLSNEPVIRYYVETEILPHLTRDLTQFTPHKNNYPFFQNRNYRKYDQIEIVQFDKVDQAEDEFKISPGDRYTPKQSPGDLSVKSIYEGILVLQHSKKEEDQIRFLNSLLPMSRTQGIDVSEEFARDHLVSVLQDKEMSFQSRKLSLYILIQFELINRKEVVTIDFLESHLKFFTESERSSIIGEMSTWKEANQEYKRKFTNVISENLLNYDLNRIISLLIHSPYNKIFSKEEVFIQAVHKNRKDVIDFLLKNGLVDPNIQDSDGRTALQLAILFGYGHITEELLKNGLVDPNIQDFKGMTALHHATNDVHVTEVLLKNGVDPSIQDSDGRTALHTAIYRGDIKAMKVLLKKRANPNIQDSEDGSTLLHYAIEYGPIKAIKVLLESEVNPNIQNSAGETALDIAIEYGNIKAIKVLLENGADPNIQNSKGRTALHTAIYRGYIKAMKVLLKKGANPNIQDSEDGSTLLHTAIQRGDIELIKVLLENRANPNIQNSMGQASLSYALYLGRIEALKALLENGVDPNIQDSIGETLLHDVTKQRDIKAMKVLLKNGADPNIQNSRGMTALHTATQHGDIKAVKVLLDSNIQNYGKSPKKILLKKEANLNIQDSLGETPLYIAVDAGYIEILQILLENGADPNIQNSTGETALQLAIDNKDIKVIEILKASI